MHKVASGAVYSVNTSRELNKAFNVLLVYTAARESVARAHMEEEAAQKCDSETEPVSLPRVQPYMRSTMNECIGIAKRLGVRAISCGNPATTRPLRDQQR
jgi:hypothetical protein